MTETVDRYAALYEWAHAPGTNAPTDGTDDTPADGTDGIVDAPASTSRRVVVLGAALAMAGCWLPWTHGRTIGSRTGFDIPVQFLVSVTTTAHGSIDIGLIVTVAALAGAGTMLFLARARLRRICGWTGVLAVSAYVGQLQRLLGRAPAAGRAGLFATIGVGVWCALAGCLAVALAPEHGTRQT